MNASTEFANQAAVNHLSGNSFIKKEKWKSYEVGYGINEMWESQDYKLRACFENAYMWREEE